MTVAACGWAIPAVLARAARQHPQMGRRPPALSRAVASPGVARAQAAETHLRPRGMMGDKTYSSFPNGCCVEVGGGAFCPAYPPSRPRWRKPLANRDTSE